MDTCNTETCLAFQLSSIKWPLDANKTWRRAAKGWGGEGRGGTNDAEHGLRKGGTVEEAVVPGVHLGRGIRRDCHCSPLRRRHHYHHHHLDPHTLLTSPAGEDEPGAGSSALLYRAHGRGWRCHISLPAPPPSSPPERKIEREYVCVCVGREHLDRRISHDVMATLASVS